MPNVVVSRAERAQDRHAVALGIDRVGAAFVAAGLLALYVPTYWDFLYGAWSPYSQGHELLILAVCAWLAYRKRQALVAATGAGQPWIALPLLLAGLAMYCVGRYVQQLQINIRLELSSQFLVLLSLLLAYRGWQAVRVMWFPLLFLVFAMPLPIGLVAAITMPLKQAVSATATQLLAALDYPVGRAGVTITIGQYRLLVAQACAGLQTLFTLEAMGLLYVNLMAYRNAWRSVLMSVLAVPIAFVANVIRVATLIVVTYHFGDAVGQGFAHSFAGILLFVVALAMLIGVDKAVDRPWRRAV